MSDIGSAFLYLLKNEGSVYTNNPLDSGGPTKFGVTLKAYAEYRHRAVEPVEIETLTIARAQTFYEDVYWHPSGCDRMVSGAVATCVFDTAVLYGVGTAARLAQGALNDLSFPLKIDGHLGDKSIDAINRATPTDFITSFHGLVLERIDAVIAANTKNEVFRQGWVNRATRLLTLKG